MRPMNNSGIFSLVLSAMLLVLLLNPAQCQNAQQGELLFQKLKCAECHSVAGVGGCLGPALDGVTARRDKAYIRLRLNKDDESSFVKLIGHPELMPHPRFGRSEVALLSDYLASLPERAPLSLHHELAAPSDKAFPRESSVSDLAEGKRLFYRSGCLSCHSVNGLGGSFAPKLDGVFMRRTPEGIESFIANPQTLGSKKMPKHKLTADERRKITQFLLTLPSIKKPYQPG